jgi:hypothetical protein
MDRIELSKITCIVDSRLSTAIDEALSDMAVPEAFIQRGKQLSFVERSRLLGFGSRVSLAESRSELYRFYVPTGSEAIAARRVAEAADLYLPGRGTLFAEDAALIGAAVPAFDPLRLDPSPGGTGSAKASERYTALCCIVQRGMGEPLARTILEMGLCVPVVSFGDGMGLRNKLGLLRVTIPVDKEILYLVVPERDGDLLEGLAVHKARLDSPGRGFIYRFNVRAYAVNIRVRSGMRSHAASMEQVISALDDLRGSSEWRRLSSSKGMASRGGDHGKGEKSLVCVSLTAEQGSVGNFVRAAMDVGAGGATLVSLARRSYSGAEATGLGVSNARESCDLIVAPDLVEPILGAVEALGLFRPEVHGTAELSYVGRALTYIA